MTEDDIVADEAARTSQKADRGRPPSRLVGDFPVFESYASPILRQGIAMPPPVAEVDAGTRRFDAVRAYLRQERLSALILVSQPDDYQAGEFLSGIPSFIGSIVCLPLAGEPFAFAPPDVSALRPAVRLLQMEQGGSRPWIADWSFGFDGLDAFARKIAARGLSDGTIGGVNLLGTPMGDRLAALYARMTLRDVTWPFNEIRARRSPQERDHLKWVAAIAEAGSEALLTLAGSGRHAGKVTAAVRGNVNRHGVTIGDIGLGMHRGLGGPVAEAGFRTIANVGFCADSGWRRSGLRPPRFPAAGIVTASFSCWHQGIEAQSQISFARDALSPAEAKLASGLRDTYRRMLDAIRAGATLAAVERLGRTHLGKLGGHVHHATACLLNPRLSGTSATANNWTLAPGMHLQVNPNIRHAGGFMSIGGGVLVSERGCDPLNALPCEVHVL